MIKIGITGGIGSGKSVVSELFTTLGIPVYIADTESKRLVNTSATIRKKLTGLFGNDLYTKTGIDRKKLASLIFNNPDLLKTVNGIIHPEVYLHFKDWTQKQRGKLCGIESAILFESGFARNVDTTVCVYAPESLRISRVKSRDDIPEELVRQRMKNQLPDEIKKEKSDYVIYNDETKALIPQVYSFLESLQEKPLQD